MGKAQDWYVLTCLSLFLFQASQIYCTSHFNEIRRLSVSSIQNTSSVNQQELRERDLIKNLPGQPLVNFRQYGGYVTVNESAGRSLYYYFVEATKTNNSLPLVLWLNGGPGCSSLGYGAFKELGPFRVQSDGKTLYANPYSWQNVANILFLESPAGTGFSYSNTKSDLENPGDMKTTEDNYAFLMKWLERFPEYKGREFYVAGESYAGHYVPLLAQTILLHNNNNQTFFNLRGILIGNPMLDPKLRPMAEKEFLATHSIISQETFLTFKNNCSADTPNPDVFKCVSLLNRIEDDIKHLNRYDIYAPLCLNSTLTKEPKEQYSTLMESDPCIEHYLTAYLNRAEVQSAMHVNAKKLPYTWKMCSGAIESWNKTDSFSTSMLPVLKELMSHENLRVWVYSGDTDAAVSVTYTMQALKKMNLTVVEQWRPWYMEGEVGGFTVYYKGNLKFMTVRGSGHEVPFYKPKSALSLFTHFILNSPLPRVVIKPE